VGAAVPGCVHRDRLATERFLLERRSLNRRGRGPGFAGPRFRMWMEWAVGSLFLV
jgi:hypothetical protein